MACTELQNARKTTLKQAIIYRKAYRMTQSLIVPGLDEEDLVARVHMLAYNKGRYKGLLSALHNIREASR